MYGKSEQVTTTGAQLFNANKMNGLTKSGVTVSVKDGMITATGMATKDEWIQAYISVEEYKKIFKPGEKIFIKSYKTTDCNYDFGLYGAHGSPILGTVTEGNSQPNGILLPTIYPARDTDFYFFVSVKQGVTLKGSLQPMVYQMGNGIYEPYTGGKPSPSPEYPQEIKSVGKWNEEKQKYEVDIKVTNAKESWDKEQTLTLTSDRPITKWDKLVEQEGQIGWLYQSAAKEYIGDNSVELYDTGFYFKISDKKIVNGEGYCKELKQYVPREENSNIAFNMSANIYVYTLNTQAIYGSTVSAIKEYLKTHPLHLAYKTEIPEFVPLPQLEQDAIRALKTYYPTTVLTVDGGDVNPDIEVIYKTKKHLEVK